MKKYIPIFLLTSFILFAGDSYMEFMKPYEFGMILSVIFFIVLMPIWLLVAMFSDSDSNGGVFPTIIFIDFAIFAISFVSMGIDKHIDSQKYMPSHSFQSPYKYGVYKNSLVAYDIKKYNQLFKEDSYRNLSLKLDKNRSVAIFYNKGYPIHSFKLNKRAESIVYDYNEDIVYALSEENNSKIYQLYNILSEPYTLAQKRVKKVINETYKPWWEFTKIPYDGISKNDIKRLSKYLNKEHIDFEYRVEKVDKNSTYKIFVSSDEKPTKSIVFKLSLDENKTKFYSIKFTKRLVKKELFNALAKELVDTKTDLKLFEWLIKYESLLTDVKNEYTSGVDDINKERVAGIIEDNMREYLWSEVAKIDKTLKKKKKVKEFRQKYKCISKYLDDIKNTRRDYSNERHPLTDANVKRYISSVFYFLDVDLKHPKIVGDCKDFLQRVVKKYHYDYQYRYYEEFGCNAGDGKACNAKAYYLLKAKEYAKAKEFYKKGCDLNYGYSCYSLGNLYKYRRYGVPNKEESQKYYKKGCDLNIRKACSKLVDGYWYGLLVKGATNETLKYLNKECDLNNSNSCHKLAYLYENNKKFKNKNKTYNYLDKACNLGYTVSCKRLAFIYKRGVLGNRNISKAKKYYKKGCDFKDGWSCIYLAKIYMKSDKKEALRIFEKLVNRKNSLGKAAAYEYMALLDKKNRQQYLTKSCEYSAGKTCCKIPREVLYKLDSYKRYKKYINKICKIKKKK